MTVLFLLDTLQDRSMSVSIMQGCVAHSSSVEQWFQKVCRARWDRWPVIDR